MALWASLRRADLASFAVTSILTGAGTYLLQIAGVAMNDRPWLASFAAVGAALVLWAAFQAIVFGYNVYRERKDRRRAAEWAGISRVYPVKGFGNTSPRSDEQFRAALTALRRSVAEEPELYLLLASGFRHFGAGKFSGWIETELRDRKTPPQTLRILLLDPACDAAKARAQQYKMTADAYEAGVQAVLWKLRGWKRERGLAMEVRLYREAPIWQMLLTNKELWLLCARQTPAEDSPIYCLRRHGPFGLAYGLEAVWERRWATATPYDLDSVSEPKDFGAIVQQTA
jgi:hypothetical protein